MRKMRKMAPKSALSNPRLEQTHALFVDSPLHVSHPRGAIVVVVVHLTTGHDCHITKSVPFLSVEPTAKNSRRIGK